MFTFASFVRVRTRVQHWVHIIDSYCFLSAAQHCGEAPTDPIMSGGHARVVRVTVPPERSPTRAADRPRSISSFALMKGVASRLRSLSVRSRGSSSSSARSQQASLSGQLGDIVDANSDAFDSPLKISLTLLSQVQTQLARRKLRSEAAMIKHVMALLHSPDLNGTQPMHQLIANGRLQADEQLEEWLTAMEWMKKDDSERGSGSRASVRPSAVSRPSVLVSAESSTLSMVELSGVDESEPDWSSAPSKHWTLSPFVQSRVQSEDEAALLRMLEHDIRTWEFDMYELDRLTGGHALHAFGWAVFERHCIRHALGIPAERLQRFLQLVEAGYKDVPYHNAMHGACVTHGVYHLLTERRCVRALASRRGRQPPPLYAVPIPRPAAPTSSRVPRPASPTSSRVRVRVARWPPGGRSAQ